MITLIKTENLRCLTTELANLRNENELLKKENEYLKMEIPNRNGNQNALPRTGWSEIDQILEEIDKLDQEFQKIQDECHDIIK